MSSLAICRVCLSVNDKIYSIQNTSLQTIYERLTTYKLCVDGRPETMCYICHSQLLTCYQLQDKSLRSEEILIQLFESGIEIKQDTIGILSRTVKHDFTTTPIEVFNSPIPPTSDLKTELTLEEKSPKNMLLDDPETDEPRSLCRICLADARARPIGNTPLQTIYERLTDSKLSVSKGRPDAVCCRCRSRLLKGQQIIHKGKRAENILAELFRNGVRLTHETVAVLNSRVKPPLKRSPIECISHFEFGAPCVVDMEKNNVLAALYRDNKRKRSKSALTFKCGACAYRGPTLNQIRRHLARHRANPRFHYRGPITCDTCKEVFKKRRKYEAHMLSHAGREIFPCDKCSKVFKVWRSLRDHRRFQHPETIPQNCQFPHYICDCCCKRFSEKANLRKHMRVHFSKMDHRCEICNRTFKLKMTLKQHLTVHMERKPNECHICDKTFGTKPNLARHLRQHLGVRNSVCKTCHKTFLDEQGLKTHERTHNDKYTCDICRAQFLRKQFLIEHIGQHSSGTRQYTCDRCGKIFLLLAALKIHMYVHKKERRAPPLRTCPKCGQTTRDLSQHMRQHSKLSLYTCGYKGCVKTFTWAGNATAHRRTHTELPRHVCHCGKRYRKSESLKVHLTTHYSDESYICDLCGASFSHRIPLITHIRKHTKSRPEFICDLCGLSYSEKRSIERHMTTHYKPVQYICKKCFKVHTKKSDLIAHLETHKKGTFTCDACSETFATLRSLCQHNRQHRRDTAVCPLCYSKMLRGTLRRHYHGYHNGVAPYACHVCEKGSARIDLVYAHYMDCHTNENRFVCDICNITFSGASGLKRHMGRQHT